MIALHGVRVGHVETGTDCLSLGGLNCTSDAQLTVNHSEISYNVNGVTASTAGAFASVGNSKIEFNSGCGLNNTAGGTNVFSFQIGGNGSNHGAGNGSNTCGSVTPLAPF